MTAREFKKLMATYKGFDIVFCLREGFLAFNDDGKRIGPASDLDSICNLIMTHQG